MQTLFQEEDAPAAQLAGQKSVLVPFPVDKAYNYALPTGIDFQDGDYVTVPLGQREVPGIIWGEGAGDGAGKKIKAVLDRHDLPPLAEAHRKFIDWAAHYVMAPKGAMLKLTLSVPGALEPEKPAKGFIAAKGVDLSGLSPQGNAGDGYGIRWSAAPRGRTGA
jgi:primosomal protein N' (replication factor Y)